MSKRVVFITDADSKSGQALVRRFARDGSGLLLNSVSGGEALQECLDSARAFGCEAVVANIDLCRSAEVAALLAEAETKLGSVDVLLHNQCAISPAGVEHGDEAAFLNIVQANAKTAFFCTQAVGKQMAARGSGAVVFVGSIHADKPAGASMPFSASQGAVKMLAREAALFLGRYGVRVNMIEMGPVEGAAEQFRSDISALYDSYRYKVPSGLPGTYEDMAELAYFLAGAESRYVNGADIRLDGGFLMHYMDHRMKKPDDLEVDPA
ncbi:SDR family NAD(P)-dependent oxidoreductase [Paenibacillus chartarius]|uniref:SDR family NAD(P)-dependent oxidoreductase n=1 Tax=Paenibacillus chartarius TaxID=747481 RepID=A0ABV6DK07_9BACL